jgi:ferritin-like metal-binding protein YciE
MISAAQKVEHYEIASYGTVRTWATLLNMRDIASRLEETLDEEKEADQKLTGIAETFVNEAAAEEPVGRGSRRATTRSGRQAAADRKR